MHIKVKLTSLLIALAMTAGTFVGAVPASAGSWQFAGWNGGGAYPSIVADPAVSGRFYMLSDVAGLWRSADRGTKWDFKTTGVTNMHSAVLTIAPSNNNVLYLGTKGGIHKSTNAGDSWTHLTWTKGKIDFKRPDNYRSIAVDRLNSSKVYASGKSGIVYVSTDGGNVWSQVGSAPFGSNYVTALYLTADGTTLFAGSMTGLAKCDTTAKSWSMVSGFSGKRVYDLLGKGTGASEKMYATYGNRVAVSSNKGLSWTYTSTIWQGEFNRLDARTTATGATEIIGAWVSGWSGGIYMSVNGGTTWADIERGISYDTLGNPSRVWSKGFGKPLSVSFDPHNPSVLFFSDFWGTFRSDDKGLTWRERITGAPNTVGSEIVEGSDGALYVATMDNGLMKSSDGGVSYKALIPNASYNSASYLGHIWRVVVSGSRIVATSSPWDVNVNQIAISTDGGASFKLVRTGLPAARPKTNTVWDQGYARALAADPTNPNRLYLGIDGDEGGFYISTNGGESWTKPASQPGSKRVYNGLAVDPTNPARLYWAAVGAGGGVYRSQDSGATWSKVFSASSYVFDVAVDKNGKVYAAADTGGPKLYTSTDKGTTWKLAKTFEGTGALDAITVDPNNASRVAVSTVKWDDYGGNKIYYSTDAGTSWTDISATLPSGSGAGDMTFSRNGAYLYMTRYAGSVYRYDMNGENPPPPPDPDPDPTPTGDTTAPTVPSSLVGSVSGTKVTLWWNASTDAVGVAGYRVYRGGTQVGTTATAKYYDLNTPAGSHTYTVRAYDSAGNLSAASNSTGATVSGSTPPSDSSAPTAPTGLLGAVSGTKVTLWWKASTDNLAVTGYRIYRNGVLIGTSAGPIFYNLNVPAGQHQYYVQAYDAAGNLSPVSNVTGAKVG